MVTPTSPPPPPISDDIDHPTTFSEAIAGYVGCSVFGKFNDNFPLYVKHEDLSEIAYSGQCLSISFIQLWIL